MRLHPARWLHDDLTAPRLRYAVLVTGILLLGVAAFLAGRWSGPTGRKQALPPLVLSRYALRTGEHPKSYRLLDDRELLASLGMEKNPDFVTQVAEIEALAGHGGILSFLALYGTNDHPRLILNGVFFRSAEHGRKFISYQAGKKRLIHAYTDIIPEGMWLLLVARDPQVSYSEAELQQIARGLERYRRRLNLAVNFSEAADTEP